MTWQRCLRAPSGRIEACKRLIGTAVDRMAASLASAAHCVAPAASSAQPRRAAAAPARAPLPALRGGRSVAAPQLALRSAGRRGAALAAFGGNKKPPPKLDPKNLPGSTPDIWESELLGGLFKARAPPRRGAARIVRALPASGALTCSVFSCAPQNGYPLVVVAAVGTVLALAWPVIQTMESTFPQARA
jgi:hypothetical protein